MSEHLSNYAARDHEVVDYKLYELQGVGLRFRGPPRDLPENGYVSCLGAAQTLGCFCEKPFPVLLEEQLGVPMLNLGYGGAGPRFFNRQPELLDVVNRGRLAIVQVMSGRSEDNSMFESRGLEVLTRRRDGRRYAADEAWRSVLESGYAWRRLPFARALARRVARSFGSRNALRLAAETRANYTASLLELLDGITIPTVLLWFSKRTPEYEPGFENIERFFGAYPQLINRASIASACEAADAYVECVTRRGAPQPLISRFTGKPVEIDLAVDRADFRGRKWTENTYYPTPEMHEDAAAALSGPVSELLNR
ncbi:MAG: DUF6473 family protein [Planctomycetota bacterium]